MIAAIEGMLPHCAGIVEEGPSFIEMGGESCWMPFTGVRAEKTACDNLFVLLFKMPRGTSQDDQDDARALIMDRLHAFCWSFHDRNHVPLRPTDDDVVVLAFRVREYWNKRGALKHLRMH
jgi:hypothetical protein